MNFSPPMPEPVADAIRRRRLEMNAIRRVVRKLRLRGVAAKADRSQDIICLAWMRHRSLKIRERRDARIPKPKEPVRIAPPPLTKIVPVEVDRLPIGAHPIKSLAEKAIGLLALPTREVRGFWRWEVSRGSKNKRVFYELAGGKEILISYHDRPKYFWPVRPLVAESIEIVRPQAIDARPPPAEMPDELVEASSAEVTEDEVRNRLYWSIRTLQALRDPEWKFLTAGNRVNWPATIAEYADLQAREENHDNKDSALRKRKWQPSREHLRDMDEPLEWFQVLNRPPAERLELIRLGMLPLSEDQWLVWWRARDISYSTVAKNIGGTNENARRRTDAVFRRLTAIANEPARIEARRIRAAAVHSRAQAERQSEVSAASA